MIAPVAGQPADTTLDLDQSSHSSAGRPSHIKAAQTQTRGRLSLVRWKIELMGGEKTRCNVAR